MRVLQLPSCLFRLAGACFDQENAGYDLQTIGDTVLHFLEQHVLFPQEFLHLRLNGTPVGNVLKCQKHRSVALVLIEDLARIQEHDAPADGRKRSIDFIPIDRRAGGCDRLPTVATLSDVHMAAVNLIEQTPIDMVAHEPKGLEEGAAGSNDTQGLIKNHKWVADGINDSLRKRKSVPDIDESAAFAGSEVSMRTFCPTLKK